MQEPVGQVQFVVFGKFTSAYLIFKLAFLPNVFEWLRNCVQETIERCTSYFDQNTEKQSKNIPRNGIS